MASLKRFMHLKMYKLYYSSWHHNKFQYSKLVINASDTHPLDCWKDTFNNANNSKDKTITNAEDFISSRAATYSLLN